MLLVYQTILFMTAKLAVKSNIQLNGTTCIIS